MLSLKLRKCETLVVLKSGEGKIKSSTSDEKFKTMVASLAHKEQDAQLNLNLLFCKCFIIALLFLFHYYFNGM